MGTIDVIRESRRPTGRMTAAALLMLAGVAVAAPSAAQERALEFEGHTWTTVAPDARVGQVLGRTALQLRSGAVFLEDVLFQDGTIEYEVAVTGHRSFVGTVFRFQESPRTEYGHFYLRPHQTGRFDALQYTPEYAGISAWQLYPEFNAPADIPVGEWVSVRVVVEGDRLRAWVGDVESPALVVDDLSQEARQGKIGLTSNFPEGSVLSLYPTAYSNIRITPAEESSDQQVRTSPAPADGTITEWEISQSYAGLAEGGSGGGLPNDISWEVVGSDAQGRVNLAEHRTFVPGTPGVHLYARVRIESDRPRRVPLHFGFSDRGRVLLNDRPVFEGNNTYLSRSGRYLGVMTVDNDTVYLDLEAGSNELVFVVSESFGGWGLVARLGEMEGVSVSVGG